MIPELSSRQELLKEFKTSGLILVEFYASWCENCATIDPTFNEWSEQYKNVKFFKVNVDKAQDLALEYGVHAMPTFIFFEDGDKVEKIVGGKIDKIKLKLESTN